MHCLQKAERLNLSPQRNHLYIIEIRIDQEFSLVEQRL